MRVLLTLALTSITFAQSAAQKSDEKAPELTKDATIEFLKAQRDITAIQEKYDQAFKNEPLVQAFTTKLKEMQKMCAPANFDPGTVTCVVPEAPKPVPSGSVAPKK